MKMENYDIFVRSKSLRWNDHLTETDELRDDCLQMEAIYLSPSKAREQYSIAEID